MIGSHVYTGYDNKQTKGKIGLLHYSGAISFTVRKRGKYFGLATLGGIQVNNDTTPKLLTTVPVLWKKNKFECATISFEMALSDGSLNHGMPRLRNSYIGNKCEKFCGCWNTNWKVLCKMVNRIILLTQCQSTLAGSSHFWYSLNKLSYSDPSNLEPRMIHFPNELSGIPVRISHSLAMSSMNFRN